MKICILGDCHSVFISQLVKNIKKQKPEFHIDGAQIGSKKSLQFENYFDKIIYLNKKNINKFSILNKFIKYVFYKYKFTKMEKYDIVNVQYVSSFYKFMWNDIKRIADKRILSFWGSDFHSISEKEKKKLLPILIESDFITFTSVGMADEFKIYYNNLKISQKVKVCRFGIASLESILKISLNKQNNFRQRNKIANNKILVAVGYSAVEARRHIEIMDSILTLDKCLLANCHFIFQMNYGDMSYKDKVKKFLKNSIIEYTVLEDFMSYDEIAEFRVETDVMINLPYADQFSASMQEVLFSKNIVITGKWLPYKLLWDKGVFALILDDFEDLINSFKYAIENINELKEKCQKNSDKIYEISSWKTNTQKWVSLYTNTLKQ